MLGKNRKIARNRQTEQVKTNSLSELEEIFEFVNSNGAMLKSFFLRA
jgi:hypothetical protein